MHNGITTQEFLLQAEVNLHSDGRLDVGLLDQVMIMMNTEKGEIQAEANRILSKFQEETNAWSSVDTILSADVSLQTKYFALQILETAIKTQWRALPEYQRTGIKEFIVGLITKTCASDHADAQVLLQKYNIVLIQCVKQDWPKNWPNFIPDLLNSSQLNQKSCVNCMRILGLLSEDVFDFGSSSLTQAKEQYLKDNLCGQFGDIFQCCLKFLEECPTHEIVSSCLKTLRRFVTWIPLTYIYDTDFLVLIVDRFLPLDNYRLLALNCLTEIFGNPSAFEGLKRENEKLAQYKNKLRDAYYRIIELLHNYIGDKFDFANIYVQGTDDDQLFIAGLADFLVAFLKENAEFVEPLTDEYSHLQSKYHDYAINLLLSLSTVNDIEIFKVCLEFWLQLAQELYRDDPFGRPATNSYNYMNGLNDIGVKESPRKLFYRPHLSQLRSIVIGRMAKPEEVLVVENDQGEVVRELVRDTDSIILYKTMRETLVFLTHLDSRDTEEKMTEKLNAQTQGGKFSWKSLNTLCWAIGSISMTMSEEEEKRFLVLVIRELLSLVQSMAASDLLGLCEQKRGKDNKAVIASNIMYIVGQYPRFLRQHWKFLKTVVNKLFEFMHESHEGVQDMACDTFIKIAIKCKRQFTTQQLGEKELFIDEMLENQGANTCDLSPPQVQVFYEAMGHIISSCHGHEEQSRMIIKLMQIPNEHWDDMIRRASIETNVIEDPELLRNIANFLKTNSAACRSIGESFSVQLLRNFIDMLSLYKLLSERIAYYVSIGNQDAFKNYIVKLMRSVKKEILVLLSTWSSKNDVAPLLAKELVPKLNSVILLDYQMTVPAARDSKVLSLYSIIISQLQDDATQYLFPILDAVFGCTLEMMQADYESFPEHRVSFFRLILAIVRSCSNFILGLDKDTQKFLLNAVVWGFEHSMRSVAELGLDILKELFENCSRLTSHREMEVAQIFYQNHYMFFLERILIAIADSSNVHVAGLTYYADVMCVIFRTAENDIKVPLAEGISNNMDYISEEVAKFFVANFSQNLTQDQIRVFVKGFFSYNRDVGAMKNHLRDFLIQIKETKGEDTSDLFLEEKEAEIMKIQQAKASIPGMVNPVDLLDEEDMLYTSNNDFLRFSQNELPSRVTVAMLSQDMS